MLTAIESACLVVLTNENVINISSYHSKKVYCTVVKIF